MTRTKTRFMERPTRFVGIDDRHGWRLKRYETTLDGSEVAGETRAAADAVLDRHLAGTAIEPEVGFVVLHAGEDAIWLFVCLWRHELLHQTTFRAALDAPSLFGPVPADGPTASVWELRVIACERETYVRHVLASTDRARVDTYLSDSGTACVSDEQTIARSDPLATIEAFNARWNAGDVDGLMELLTETPEYRASTGSGPGEVHRGATDVRAAFKEVMASESALGAPPPAERTILVDGNRGVSSWTYRGRDRHGEPCLIQGVDLWTFERGRIALKDAYRKAFPDAG